MRLFQHGLGSLRERRGSLRRRFEGSWSHCRRCHRAEGARRCAGLDIGRIDLVEEGGEAGRETGEAQGESQDQDGSGEEEEGEEEELGRANRRQIDIELFHALLQSH